MKKVITIILTLFLAWNYTGLSAWAIQDIPNQKTLKPSANAKKIEIAFVFDGKNDKNEEMTKTFQQTITRSLLPDYIAVFPKDLIFTGDWTEKGARAVSDKALQSRAKTVISLGFLSSTYLSEKPNKKKYVITIDEYSLRGNESKAFYNPVKQYVGDFVLFRKLVKDKHKTAILINENFYRTQKDWKAIAQNNFKEKDSDLQFAIVPISAKNVQGALNSIPKDCDSVFVTPLFDLSTEQRKQMFSYFISKKLPAFSTFGEIDVEAGALMGTSTPDAYRKIAEATSFNIHGYLHGNAVKNEKLMFYDDKVIFYNKDTGESIGYPAPLRLLNNCQIISHKPIPKYDLSYVFNKLDESNLDIIQKKYLVDAARRSTVSAYLKYLPTLRIDLGYQSYNDDYANSYTNVPSHVGQFVIGLDQMIYSPDLVTNIIVKHKKLNFEKAEKVLTAQNMGLEIGYLYLDVLMFENMIKVQEDALKEDREDLAIAKVREKMGYCGKEEVLQWAGRVSNSEKRLLAMKADYNNVKIQINKLLNKDQKEEYSFVPLTASDPAFFTSDLHILDHIRTPEKLGKFTDMIVAEAIYLAPETTKLRAAIAMKKAEMANYGQKFFMPNAKLTYEYGSQFNRDLPYEAAGHRGLAAAGVPYINLNTTSSRFYIAAQWKPIEGGQKFAEIARCKSELNQLNAYLLEVNTKIEMNVRSVINRAIAKYFIIEKSYKTMFAESESYEDVKAKYLRGEAPITQLMAVKDMKEISKAEALNSQYEFFKELMWVQRGLVAVNWTKASQEAKDWLMNIPNVLPAEPDFSL